MDTDQLRAQMLLARQRKMASIEAQRYEEAAGHRLEERRMIVLLEERGEKVEPE